MNETRQSKYWIVAGALEQESWAAVPVPHDSQQLVDHWAERAQRLKPLSPSKLPPVANDKTSVAGRCQAVVTQYSSTAVRGLTFWPCLHDDCVQT